MGQKQKQVPKKFCRICGVLLTRQRFNGRLEDYGVFLRRNHCSLTCANTRKIVTKSAYYWRARKFRKNKCEACGSGKSLHVHHIDQNYKNNSAKNLQTLCIHCHKFWHDTQERLGLSIAGRMPPLNIGWTSLPESQESQQKAKTDQQG